MELGDFTNLAKNYVNRPGYSLVVLSWIGKAIGALPSTGELVADVGAGTGKLTENLCELGLTCVAVEPNDAMREEGKKYCAKFAIDWRAGSGEATGLQSSSAAWLLMGSSFHWTDPAKSLPEFHRVLRPGGHFTAIWNPRDIESSELHSRIERQIYEIAPTITRVSSGSQKYTTDLEKTLVGSGLFSNCIFVESHYEISMPKDRFLGAWRSVNDIQAQAGPERFAKILAMIEDEVRELESVPVPYRSRAWTVRRVD